MYGFSDFLGTSDSAFSAEPGLARPCAPPLVGSLTPSHQFPPRCEVRKAAGEPLPLERDGGDPAAGVAGHPLEVVPSASGVAVARLDGSSAAFSSISASSSAFREGVEQDAAAAVQRSRSGRRELLDAMAGGRVHPTVQRPMDPTVHSGFVGSADLTALTSSPTWRVEACLHRHRGCAMAETSPPPASTVPLRSRSSARSAPWPRRVDAPCCSASTSQERASSRCSTPSSC